jgi:hypothetical protein
MVVVYAQPDRNEAIPESRNPIDPLWFIVLQAQLLNMIPGPFGFRIKAANRVQPGSLVGIRAVRNPTKKLLVL